MKTKIFFIISMACAANMLHAQTTVNYTDFEKKVMEFSQTLKQSMAEQTAMRMAMKEAKTAFFPAVDAVGNYQYQFNKDEMNFGDLVIPMKHYAYCVDVGIIQPIYAGGSIYHNYKASQIQSEIADMTVELTTDNVIYAAQASYWGTAAQKEMYGTMSQYVKIIQGLAQVLKISYQDGLINKTDLIQMEVRQKEAELQRSNSYQAYQIALQNMNILMGLEPFAETIVAEPVSQTISMPLFIGADAAMQARPDYAISLFDVDYQKRQVSLAASTYNPTVSIGFKQAWGTQMLNFVGEASFSSTVFASVQIPLFRWGARFKSIATQKALLTGKQYALENLQDQISEEVAKAWTSLNESTRRIQIANENRKLAEENLESNTLSYTEGKRTILDVLSAQLTWIQSHTSMIQAYYEQKIALADYRKAVGVKSL